MSDIFQEVEEDVRRERYEQLWKQYGNYIIALAVVIVLAVAGYQAWQRYDLAQRQRISDRYREASQAEESGNLTKAETDFAALAKEAPSGYAALSRMQLAGVYLAEGKRDQAIALLRELMGSSDTIISTAARLRLAWALADASQREEIAAILQPLTANNSPWRFAAAEVLAYVDLKTGARAQAQAEYQQLAQETLAPAALRQRAAGIAEFLRANPNSGIAAPSAPALPATPAPAAAAPSPITPAPASTGAPAGRGP
jgi:hypothetical protein